jgi:hypothetical protein
MTDTLNTPFGCPRCGPLGDCNCEPKKIKVHFAVQELSTGKFVSGVTGAGKVYTVRNPFSANYFVESKYAAAWMEEKGLSIEKFTVQPFTKA